MEETVATLTTTTNEEEAQEPEPSAPPQVSVVRIGPVENPSTRLLRSAILHHFQSDDKEAGRVVLDNRYFTAHVEFRDLEGAAASSGMEGGRDDGTIEDGMILVFDADDASHHQPQPLAAFRAAFDRLSPLHAAAERREQSGEVLRLCVGVMHTEQNNSTSSKEEQEEEYSRRVLWCLDHGYEYVEAHLDPEALARGHDERDKEGFPRIVEAIGSTMWSTAVMKPRAALNLRQAYQEDRQALTATTTTTTSSDAIVTGEEGNDQYEPPSFPLFASSTISNTTNTTSEAEAKTNETEAGGNAAAPGASDDAATETSTEVDAVATPKEPETKEGEEEGEEALFDDLECIIREAARVRDASRSGELSDEERRKRAGDAAVLLMGLLDKLGFDEEDDDDEDEAAANVDAQEQEGSSNHCGSTTELT